MAESLPILESNSILQSLLQSQSDDEYFVLRPILQLSDSILQSQPDQTQLQSESVFSDTMDETPTVLELQTQPNVQSESVFSETIDETPTVLELQTQPNLQSQSVFSESECESQDSQNSQSSENSQSSQSSQPSGRKVCECEKIQGKRRDKTILHSITEHQLYVRNKSLADGSIAYTCSEKNCKARPKEKNGVFFFCEPFYGHLHGNKEAEIAEMKLLAQIKTQCSTPSGSQTTSQISEVREIFDGAVLQ